ncbi:hypothetical protein LSM04_006901 [Trypanosoma melophagium]|uniref:uncharacterized protein n=1 Tax=Trypanosoma melophagium TaxID=715481 RepID=UPI003519DD3C|nr:hypothetical protein LSM04_006901 [Trypanosoma melophagium]
MTHYIIYGKQSTLWCRPAAAIGIFNMHIVSERGFSEGVSILPQPPFQILPYPSSTLTVYVALTSVNAAVVAPARSAHQPRKDSITFFSLCDIKQCYPRIALPIRCSPCTQNRFS